MLDFIQFMTMMIGGMAVLWAFIAYIFCQLAHVQDTEQAFKRLQDSLDTVIKNQQDEKKINDY